MKKLFFLTLLFWGKAVFSQDCDNYYYLQNNKTVEMTSTDKKGKVTSKMLYMISDVQKSGGTVTSKVTSELFDSKGKSINKALNNIKCTGGVMMMDLKMFISSEQQGQMGTVSEAGAEAYLEYPANMKEGDALKDGKYGIDITTKAGLGGHISVDITNRKVAGKESVTTPAGTWDCYKITYHSKVVLKIILGIPISADITEWYAPEFGVVKSDIKGNTTEITAVK